MSCTRRLCGRQLPDWAVGAAPPTRAAAPAPGSPGLLTRPTSSCSASIFRSVSSWLGLSVRFLKMEYSSSQLGSTSSPVALGACAALDRQRLGQGARTTCRTALHGARRTSTASARPDVLACIAEPERWIGGALDRQAPCPWLRAEQGMRGRPPLEGDPPVGWPLGACREPNAKHPTKYSRQRCKMKQGWARQAIHGGRCLELGLTALGPE